MAGFLMKDYLNVAFSKSVVQTATKVALLVGTLLVMINHYSAISSLHFTEQAFFQIALTYCVPYAVSTYSSVKYIRSGQK